MLLFFTFSFLIYGFGLVFLDCELCQRATDKFDEICEQIGRFDWYLFSYKIQRMLPMILIAAQRPVEQVSFGSAVCSRDTFKRVSVPFYQISFRIAE